ncbi:MAG: MATE family efflux transporter [Clostridiales bacterium]|nr:MATE family efflux transporter [Clostridiales bacterium]
MQGDDKTIERNKGSAEAMGSAKLPGLIFRLAAPMIAAQLINVLYNIIDRIYIGRMEGIGEQALTGVGVTFPVITIIAAFSNFVGAGGAPLAAIALGKQEKARAERILGNGVALLLLFSALLMAMFPFQKDILMLFGASENTVGYATDYLSIYLCGTVFVQLATGLNMFITAQGKTGIAMLSVLIGAVLNIALDPVFIFVFSMGVRGAALATVISQAVSALWVCGFLCSSKSGLRIRLQNMKPDCKIILSTLALGSSPFVMAATESLINVVVNSGLQHYGGDAHVGAMVILSSIMQLIVVPIGGFTQGVQPIISYNFGAGNRQRVKGAYRILLGVTLAASMLCWAGTLLFPRALASLFAEQGEMLELAVQKMPIFFAGVGIFGLQRACQSAFLALGQAKMSMLMALLRKVILLTPLALLLPLWLGVDGIYFAEPLADILAALTTFTLFTVSFNRILDKGV